MTLDLDAIQADIDRYGGTNREQGTDLVAELRAAREVVTAVKKDRGLERRSCGCGLPVCAALAAYDKTVGEVGS